MDTQVECLAYCVHDGNVLNYFIYATTTYERPLAIKYIFSRIIVYIYARVSRLCLGDVIDNVVEMCSTMGVAERVNHKCWFTALLG